MLNLGVKLYNGEEVEDGSDLGEEGYDAVTVSGTVITGEGQIAITKENCYDFGF
jgi:simple sugar transport system substrate-binding protein